MNFPTLLTLLRIFFVPLLVVLLLTKGPSLDLWAAAVLLTAAVTDVLDGYLARRHRQITALGILLDPIADKLLICSALIALVELGLIPAWMVVIIVGRELAVSGLRAVASAEGMVIQASDLGKAKMVLEVAAITTLVLEHHFEALRNGDFRLGTILVWLVLALAVASGVQYFLSFWKRFDRKAAQLAPHAVVFRPGEKAEQIPQERDVAAR
jgi:CDP-diacylglycerol---glycerol-3-phosphate 3-phosphatidyltransferase